MSIINTDADPAARDDRADMERLAAGHDAALNDLMERHATPVFHFLCRMVGNEDDANDLAQETFVRVFRARASFRPGKMFSTGCCLARKADSPASLFPPGEPKVTIL
jgi:RNA polymerase sigma-70 factor (ECF subfamily)